MIEKTDIQNILTMTSAFVSKNQFPQKFAYKHPWGYASSDSPGF